MYKNLFQKNGKNIISIPTSIYVDVEYKYQSYTKTCKTGSG